MKIVHISLIYFDEWQYQENILAKYHVKFGNAVYVISSKVSLASYKKYRWKKSKYEYNGIKIIRLNPKYFLTKKLLSLYNLKNTLEEIQPDVIILHGGACLCLFDVIKYKKSHNSCKFVVDFHSDFFNSGRNLISKLILHKILWRFILQNSKKYFDKVYYVAPSVKEFIKQCYKFKEDELESLYLGADYEYINYNNKTEVSCEIRKKYNLKDSDFVICTGGKIDEYKRIDILIEAINLFEDNNIKLIIFGSIEREEYKKYLEYQWIVYTGWLNAREVYDIYFASDLIIFPGNQSVLWQQAICSGTPTIFRYNAYDDYLDIGGNCLFLFSDLSLELKQLITILYQNRDVLKKMRKSTINKARDIFSYEYLSKKILNF